MRRLRILRHAGSMMSAASFKRCRHIITENARVLEAREALLRGDVERFGELMVEAHASMRDDFAASCEEVDVLVEIAVQQAGVFWGADYRGRVWRLHGECGEGRGWRSDLWRRVRREYAAKTGIEADCFVCTPSDGAFALAKKGGIA